MRTDEAPSIKGADTELTARQREVLQLIGENHGTKEIAAILNISIKTVEYHKTCLMREVNLHATSELMRYAITQGLASPEP